MKEAFTSDGIEFIDEDEREDIVEYIQGKYWPHIRAKGHFVIVKPYTREDKIDGVLIPGSVGDEDKHHSLASQVIDIGPAAYIDEKYCGGVSWAQIGDWVVVPRVSGIRVGIVIDGKETMFRLIREDDIAAIVSDPKKMEVRVSITKF